MAPAPALWQGIADKTGATLKQVNNWFINMRKRHWLPQFLPLGRQPETRDEAESMRQQLADAQQLAEFANSPRGTRQRAAQQLPGYASGLDIKDERWTPGSTPGL